jgi:hypothetical protein
MNDTTLRPIDIVIGQEMNCWDSCYGPAVAYALAVADGRVDPAETRLDIICANAGIDEDGQWGYDDAERGIGGVWAYANGHVEDDSGNVREPRMPGRSQWAVIVYEESLKNANLNLDLVAAAFDDCESWADRVEACCESIARSIANLPTVLALR